MGPAIPVPSAERLTRTGAGWLFAALGLVLPVAVLFAPRVPTALAILAALASGGLIAAHRQAFRLPAPAVLCALSGLCLVAALSTAWALDASLAWRGAIKLLGHILVGLLVIGGVRLLRSEERRRALGGLAIGVTAALAILAAESFLDSPVTRLLAGEERDVADIDFLVSTYGAYWFNAGGSVVAVLIWPLGLFPRVGRRLLAPALLALAAALYGIGFAAGALAVVLGGGAAFAVAVAGRRAVAALIVVLVAAVLMAPLAPRTVLEPERLSAMDDVFPSSVLPRIHIWSFVAARIAEKPLGGWGMNASRTMPGETPPSSIASVIGPTGKRFPCTPTTWPCSSGWNWAWREPCCWVP